MKMKFKFKFILAASVFALASQVQASAVNLVQNGSFEADVIADNSYVELPSITNWTTDVGHAIEIRNNHVGQASDGVNFVELDSNNNSSIYQTIATTVGQTYTLSFDYSPRENQITETNPINVFWSGSLITSPEITGDGTGQIGNVWTNYVFTVIGNGSDVLQFAAAGTSDSFGGAIDNVSVSAVPLPAAAFLFAPALLGFMGLRRKAKNVVAA